MSEQDLLIECAKEASKELVKEVYQDVVQPIVKPIAETVALLPRAIQAALIPAEQWIEQRRYNLEATKKLLQQKLENIPPEQIETPEAHIAVPALQYISYCMDNEELRNMYANLLATSMVKVVKKGVHPSYLEIIKQLSPDEAKILKYFYTHRTIPVMSFIKKDVHGNLSYALRDFSNIGEKAGCEFPHFLNRQFNNLMRLGLIDKAPSMRKLTDVSLYQELLESPIVKNLKETFSKDTNYVDVLNEESFMSITPFGEGFCSVCLDTPQSYQVSIHIE